MQLLLLLSLHRRVAARCGCCAGVAGLLGRTAPVGLLCSRGVAGGRRHVLWTTWFTGGGACRAQRRHSARVGRACALPVSRGSSACGCHC